MKRWQKVLLIIVLVLSIWFTLNLWAIGTSVCIVRMQVSGWGIFAWPVPRYYAVREQGAVEVPGWMVFLFCNGAVTGSTQNDHNGQEWHATLSYDEDGTFGGLDDRLNTPWVPTGHSENHRLYYDFDDDEVSGEEQLAVLQHAAETLHDGTTADWVSYESDGGIYDLAGLVLLEAGGRRVLEYRCNGNSAFYSVGEDGTYRLLLSEPEDWVTVYVHVK